MFSRIKNLDIFWRKAILYSVISVLGLAMVTIIGMRFKSQLQNASRDNFLDQAAFLELKNRTKQDWQRFQAEKQRLEQELQALSTTTATSVATTSSTSTSATPTSSGVY